MGAVARPQAVGGDRRYLLRRANQLPRPRFAHRNTICVLYSANRAAGLDLRSRACPRAADARLASTRPAAAPSPAPNLLFMHSTPGLAFRRDCRAVQACRGPLAPDSLPPSPAPLRSRRAGWSVDSREPTSLDRPGPSAKATPKGRAPRAPLTQSTAPNRDIPPSHAPPRPPARAQLPRISSPSCDGRVLFGHRPRI